MNGLLEVILNEIFDVGMSTVNAISRADVYEPVEDVELAEWVERNVCTKPEGELKEFVG